MIFLRAFRVSFVLFVTPKAFESKVNSIGSGRAKSLLEAKMGVADAHFLALKPAF
jgi:hypothetical protein